MRMLIVVPQRQIKPIAFNSIDLYAQSLLERSCHRYSVLTHQSGGGLFGPENVIRIPRSIENHAFPTGVYAAATARRMKCDLVIVHQRFQIAVALSRFCPGLPVVYHGHGFYKGYQASQRLRRQRRLRELLKLSGMVHVSEACQTDFASKWPDVDIAQDVIPNGLDFGSWTSNPQRTQEIICIGRAIPEKGLLEAATATAAALAKSPDWTARFVISEAQRQPAQTEKILRALHDPQTEGRAFVEYDLPWADVKSRMEQAAIAVVPSLLREAFGRTALEAHAAGAAVISSGTGGLPEVSGEHALYANPAEPGALASALHRLMTDAELRGALAENGRRRAEQRFQITGLAKRADDFYNTCVARSSVKAR